MIRERDRGPDPVALERVGGGAEGREHDQQPRQRPGSDETEALAFPHQAESKPKILAERVERRQPTLVAITVFDLIDAAEHTSGGEASVGNGLPLCDELVDQRIEMRLHLF